MPEAGLVPTATNLQPPPFDLQEEPEPDIDAEMDEAALNGGGKRESLSCLK